MTIGAENSTPMTTAHATTTQICVVIPMRRKGRHAAPQPRSITVR